MIDNYSFIDANSSGNKEAFISGNKVGFNKLSANETNLIKDKLNEIIGQVNLNQIPLYPNFSLKLKGENNLMLNQLQVGDIVHGFYDANTIWTNARYNGGDINEKANYTNLDEGIVTRIEKFSDLYSGSSTFTLPTFAQIIEVSVNGWSTENYTTPNDTTVIINDTINTGQQVVILYLIDENSNIAPYYTQAQTDALIAGAGGGGVITGDYTPVLTMHQNILNGTVAGASFSKSNNLVTLHLYIEVVLSTSGQGTLRVTVPTQYPIADVPENLTIGSGTLQNNGYNHIFVQKQSATTLNLNFIANISGVLNGIMYATVIYKTT